MKRQIFLQKMQNAQPILSLYESPQAEIEELWSMLLSCAREQPRKGEGFGLDAMRDGGENSDALEGSVCITCGLSYLGLAIASQLLTRGYCVRLIVSSEEDLEKLREMEASGELRAAHNTSSIMMNAVVANFGDVASLSEAFEGCRGVFHTAALVDPSGLSGYSKSMGEIEVKACENVMEACARTSSVRKCVLTSSLLACIWGDHSISQSSSTVNHNTWSDESVCIEKKLWYALGKLRAEKVAWKIAEKRDFMLVTICPGLITGPLFCLRNPTASIAYLKGAQDMYAKRLLAWVDVNKLADAHVCIYKAMNNKNASGRYICFDRVVQSEEAIAIENLTREMGMQLSLVSGNGLDNCSCKFELSNIKLSELMARTRCRDEY